MFLALLQDAVSSLGHAPCVRGERGHQLLKRHLRPHRHSWHTICVHPPADVRRFADAWKLISLAVSTLRV